MTRVRYVKEHTHTLYYVTEHVAIVNIILSYFRVNC